MLIKMRTPQQIGIKLRARALGYASQGAGGILVVHAWSFQVFSLVWGPRWRLFCSLSGAVGVSNMVTIFASLVRWSLVWGADGFAYAACCRLVYLLGRARSRYLQHLRRCFQGFYMLLEVMMVCGLSGLHILVVLGKSFWGGVLCVGSHLFGDCFSCPLSPFSQQLLCSYSLGALIDSFLLERF
jgi:hypothetical protein